MGMTASSSQIIPPPLKGFMDGTHALSVSLVMEKFRPLRADVSIPEGSDCCVLPKA